MAQSSKMHIGMGKIEKRKKGYCKRGKNLIVWTSCRKGSRQKETKNPQRKREKKKGKKGEKAGEKKWKKDVDKRSDERYNKKAREERACLRKTENLKEEGH